MNPAQVQAQLQQAIAHHKAGRLPEAEAAYARLCAVAPRNFDVFHLAGALALQRGKTFKSLELLERALELNPASQPCALRLGLALMTAGRLPEAEARLRRVVEQQPDFADGWDNLGHCLKRQDRLEEARDCHRRVVALKPGHAPGWYHYGSTLNLCGQAAEAITCHERALSEDPGYARAHFGLAQALQQSGRPAEAVAAYDRFLKLEPRHVEARSQRLFALQYLDGLSREQLLEEHRVFGRSLSAGTGRSVVATGDPGKRLRVGILSPDLRQHSCAYFLEPLLRHLDREAFELFLYHDHIREDAVSERLRGLASNWRNLIDLPAAEVESTLREDGLDVLIELAGHTAPVCRLPLLARGPAPVQISYLGYPDTTGVPGIGWRFTDAVADPIGEGDAFATETLVRFAPTAASLPERLPAADSPRPSGPRAPGRRWQTHPPPRSDPPPHR